MLLSTIDRADEAEVLLMLRCVFFIGDAILVETMLDRAADDGTNAKPRVEGADNRQKIVVAIDFILISIRIGASICTNDYLLLSRRYGYGIDGLFIYLCRRHRPSLCYRRAGDRRRRRNEVDAG